MFDANTLSQLSQLKTDIQSTKDYAEGTVAATSGRFGFVRTDDGRDAFLSPEKMDRVLPGDRVKVSITENAKGKLEAEFEKLISSDIKKFVGQYRVKGAGHFVVPGGNQFTRWIFVPPNQRKGSKDGDFVVAKMARHPYRDGKAQANVVFRIGQPGDDFIEHKYTKAKYELNYRITDTCTKQTVAVCDAIGKGEAPELETLTDLTHLGFVTIDSASTLDMDDALYAEKTDDGHRLFVAIAAPSQFIDNRSALGQHAQQCAQSVYLLGGAVPMLPPQLAHYTFSLEAEKIRPALVAQLDITSDGHVSQATFSQAKVKSHHKLSYDDAADYLNNNKQEAIPESCHSVLSLLKEVSDQRRSYRETHYLVSDDHTDFDFSLDSKGHIENIRLRTRNAAHQVVEEAMIATNIEAGLLLKNANAGLHLVHSGFREDRIGEVRALLKEEQLDSDNINTLDGHVALLKKLNNDSEKQHLIPALRRMMIPSELSHSPSPHMGMGVPAYATITSPIRRYVDMYNHWCIQAVLTNTTPPGFNEETTQALNDVIRNGRQADRELQQWLICMYTKQQLGNTATGTIRIVTQQGFGVKINDNGIEGFVLFNKKTEKSFDAKRMTLTVGESTYHIGDEVNIKIDNVDLDKRRIAFSLAQ